MTIWRKTLENGLKNNHNDQGWGKTNSPKLNSLEIFSEGYMFQQGWGGIRWTTETVWLRFSGLVRNLLLFFYKNTHKKEESALCRISFHSDIRWLQFFSTVKYPVIFIHGTTGFIFFFSPQTKQQFDKCLCMYYWLYWLKMSNPKYFNNLNIK